MDIHNYSLLTRGYFYAYNNNLIKLNLPRGGEVKLRDSRNEAGLPGKGSSVFLFKVN